MVFKTIRFSGDGLPDDEKEFMERVKLYGIKWFEQVFENNGFTLKKNLGDYRGSEYNEAESPRLIMIAKKESF
jgi:hypothetical protein